MRESSGMRLSWQGRGKKSLTSISKANALNYSMVFWDQIFEEVSREYPDVETHSYLVDAASMLMVKDPRRFEIVVTSNLFGDILTDLGAAIAGGMGLAAGANLNPERIYPSMFEPIHGSAPDIAGQGKANPLAAIWSASQMLDFFGHGGNGKQGPVRNRGCLRGGQCPDARPRRHGYNKPDGGPCSCEALRIAELGILWKINRKQWDSVL